MFISSSSNAICRAPTVLLIALIFTQASIAITLPLFSNETSSIQTLHTNLTTLLPILPLLVSPPSNTLVVTMATSAFKPLLFNWMCFLRYKSKQWSTDKNELPQFLIITHEKELALELSDKGIVVWWLNYSELNRLESNYDSINSQNDVFLNLHLLNLLPTSQNIEEESDIITWGSFQYQSLMLERSIAVSLLVGALVEIQAEKCQVKYDEKIESSNEVHGVLLVDNDAVWISSPSNFLIHPYTSNGSHPSLIYSLDSPPSSETAWGSNSGTPCACFIYSRTSDASPFQNHTSTSASPSLKASNFWRNVAICHILMLLDSFSYAQQSQLSDQDIKIRARAPSFQASCLGPAIFLSQESIQYLPSTVSHNKWIEVLASGNIQDLLKVMKYYEHSVGTSFLRLVKQIQQSSPNPTFFTSLSNPQQQPLVTSNLSFDLFPSGQRYFHEQRLKKVKKPVVIHANYIIGSEKENMLKRENLWSLTGNNELGWSCDK